MGYANHQPKFRGALDAQDRIPNSTLTANDRRVGVSQTDSSFHSRVVRLMQEQPTFAAQLLAPTGLVYKERSQVLG